jgi:hypothetical protein
VTCANNAAYDTLTDGLMAIFHHELFHNLQRNINLHRGGSGAVDEGEDAWQFYSEGTAVLASVVGQPRGQFARPRANSHVNTYMSYANSFVLSGGGTGSQDLNTSYREIFPYRAALYWRFLYEQCGGMSAGAEDSAAGMQVIRHALTTLYSGKVVDIRSSDDLVGTLPQVMDRALAGSSCPFQTYRESLVAFARALYGLRLDGGRCAAPGIPAGCSFYDPHHQYLEPALSAITYAGARQEHRGGIAGSFGIDLIEVALDPAADGQSLVLEFYGAPSGDARFDLQLLPLLDSGPGGKPRPIPAGRAAMELLSKSDPDGRQVYIIRAIDTALYNRLGLIITRLDARETLDPLGEYTILLRPGVG